MSHFAIGFDIGGTTSRAAVVDQDHRVVESIRRETPANFEELLTWICAAIRALSVRKIALDPSVGIALAGLIDESRNSVARSVNLSWLDGKPLVRAIEQELGTRPLLISDCDASTWAEFIAARETNSTFAHLRLGTGVACGVVSDGQLIGADPERRTHWPLLVVESTADAPSCACGLRGCLELYASGKALTATATHAGLGDLPELATACRRGAAKAVSIVQTSARAIGRALGNVASEFGLDFVVLGGGVMDAVPALLDFVRRDLQGAMPQTAIGLSRLGDDAGVIGAAELCGRPSPHLIGRALKRHIV